MKKQLLLILGIFFYFQSNGQHHFEPGYVILGKDTVPGLVGDRNSIKNARECLYKKDAFNDPVKYHPADIAGFGFDHTKKHYATKTWKDTEQQTHTGFLEVLVEGALTLYYRKDTHEKDYFFVEKGDSKVFELRNTIARKKYESQKYNNDWKTYKIEKKEFMRLLLALCADCADAKVKKKIENARRTIFDLTAVVSAYNTCISPEKAYEQEKETLKLKTRISLTLGVRQSSFDVKSAQISRLNQVDFVQYTTGNIGIAFNFVFPRVNERFSVQTALLYSPRSHFTGVKETATKRWNYDLNLKSSFRLPLLARYTFGKAEATFRPYIEAGISNNFTLSIEDNTSFSFLDGTEAITSETLLPTTNYRKYEQGWMAGIGSTMYINAKNFLFLELLYERTNGVSKAAAIQTPVTSFHLMTGFGF